jgi:ribosomal-protein-alanine N-acetyltransferase
MNPLCLETERIILRPYTMDDLDTLADILKDPDVMRFMPGNSPLTREKSEKTLKTIIDHWEKHDYGWWAVTLKGNPQAIGWCGLGLLDETGETEVLYLLDKPYWNHGITSEAVKASLRYGFEELKLDRIIALAFHENIGSRRVMEKCNLTYMKDAVYFGLNLVCYHITREEFQADDSVYIIHKAGIETKPQ